MRYLFLAFMTIVSCGQETLAPPELLNDLQPLVAIPDPVAIPMPNEGEEQFAKVTFYTAVPKSLGGAIGRPFVDKLFLKGIRGKVQPTAGKLEDHGNIRIIVLQTKAAVPSRKVAFETLGKGDHLLRYGVNFFVLNGPRRNTLGDFWITDAPDSEKLQWLAPEIDILNPANGHSLKSGGNLAIEGKLVNHNDEPVRLSWYVSTGSLNNRHSLSPTWSGYEPGNQLIILVARGLKSRGAAIVFRDVEVL